MRSARGWWAGGNAIRGSRVVRARWEAPSGASVDAGIVIAFLLANGHVTRPAFAEDAPYPRLGILLSRADTGGHRSAQTPRPTLANEPVQGTHLEIRPRTGAIEETARAILPEAIAKLRGRN